MGPSALLGIAAAVSAGVWDPSMSTVHLDSVYLPAQGGASGLHAGHVNRCKLRPPSIGQVTLPPGEILQQASPSVADLYQVLDAICTVQYCLLSVSFAAMATILQTHSMEPRCVNVAIHSWDTG